MIKKRKHGKERFAGQSSASHLLKIGFNSSKEQGKAFFGKLRGFVVFRNQAGDDGKFPVDYGLMHALISSNVRRDPAAARAWREEMKRLKITISEQEPVTLLAVGRAIDAQFEAQLDAPENILPQRIEFVLPSAGVPDGHGGWNFPGLYDDSYQAHRLEGCKGLFCKGNGDMASRWQPDSTRKTIPCNPLGKEGIENADDFCPYSKPAAKLDKRTNQQSTRNGNLEWNPSPCQAVGTLSLHLGYRDAAGVLQPLSRLADARFELETRSEKAQLKIGTALSLAADRLQGQIGGISGTISFNMRTVATPHHVGGQNSVVQQIDFILNPLEIALREAQMREGRVLEGQATRLLLSGAVAPTVTTTDAPRNEDEHDDDAQYEPASHEDHDPTTPGPAVTDARDTSNASPMVDHVGNEQREERMPWEQDDSAKEEPKPLPMAIALADCTLADMVFSLGNYIRIAANERGVSLEQQTEELTDTDLDGHLAKSAKVDDIRKYGKATSPDKVETAKKILQHIIEKLVLVGEDRLVLVRAPEKGEGK